MIIKRYDNILKLKYKIFINKMVYVAATVFSIGSLSNDNGDGEDDVW